MIEEGDFHKEVTPDTHSVKIKKLSMSFTHVCRVEKYRYENPLRVKNLPDNYQNHQSKKKAWR